MAKKTEKKGLDQKDEQKKVEKEGSETKTEILDVKEDSTASNDDKNQKAKEEKGPKKGKEERVKEGKEEKPVRGKMTKVVAVLLAVILLFIILMGTGLVGGMYLYPNVGNWLRDREISVDFFERYRLNENELVGSDGERMVERVIQVTSEESNIIRVVEENMHSVVSVAISEMQFSPNEGIVDRSSNIGTGFIVDPNGIIVTNQHVVSNLQASYKIVTENGTEYDVQSILRDDVNDIAILKINAEGLNAVKLGDSNSLVQGQTVIAIGTPLGEFAGSVTTGVISGLNRSVTTGGGGFFGTIKTFENVIQTDAAINPGNSGGPLLNSVGEVVGVNFATSSSADNISFALPINRVKVRLDEFRKFGKFLRPYIGIEYQMVSSAEARFLDGVMPGAFVRNVVDGSPAQEAGIQRGDIITKINDTEVTRSFADIIQNFQIGEEVEVEVLRDGELINLSVTLGEAD